MTLTNEEIIELLAKLKTRFESNIENYNNIEWEKVQSKIENNLEKLYSIYKMEETGGEPSLFYYDDQTDTYFFTDFSIESPSGRRSLCYDDDALQSRKKDKPRNSAIEMAKEMGVELLTEELYRKLQTMGSFENKTSSWIKTSIEIRSLGGALFCDRRYNKVFTYHNGAESYYSARGFRGILSI